MSSQMRLIRWDTKTWIPKCVGLQKEEGKKAVWSARKEGNDDCLVSLTTLR